MGLDEYRRKRDFRRTAEPRGRPVEKPEGKLTYIIQKHDASHLHYDFRLELNGVLKSWAVPKGPDLDPANKRLAMQVEDHPLEYGGLRGNHPAGRVWRWNRDALGQGRVGADGRPGQGLPGRSSQIHPARGKASGWLDARSQRRPQGRGGRAALVPVQRARRVCPAG